MRIKLKDVLQTTYLTDGGYYALYGIPQTLTYGNTVYQKGGQVVHTLRGYMGDSLFFGGIKAYLQEFGYNYASTYDLRDFLTSYSGIDLIHFFDAWVFNPGFPHFSIDSTVSVISKNGYDFTVFVRQKLRGTTEYSNANHLEITFMDNAWRNFTDTLAFSGIIGHKTFHLPFSPTEVMVDVNEKISDATTDEFKIIQSPGEYYYPQSFFKLVVEKLTDSALVRITHNWVAPDSVYLPGSGFQISNSRYWTVEGILPAGFKARGEFTYSNSAGIDKWLIKDSKASLVMLYRSGSGQPWKEISFTRSGSWTDGEISVDNLKKGQYALAVRDSKYMDREKK